MCTETRCRQRQKARDATFDHEKVQTASALSLATRSGPATHDPARSNSADASADSAPSSRHKTPFPAAATFVTRRLPARSGLVQGRAVRSVHTQRRASRRRSTENFDHALAALGADELRAFVRTALDHLDRSTRGVLEDLLLQHAVGKAGWTPTAPAPAVVDDARAFIASAKQVAQANPSDIDDLLRLALEASLAGDHGSARAVFETVLTPICNGDIYLGQDELVEEVLSVELSECARRLITAAYLMTPLADRADALLAACELTHDLWYTQDPPEEIATTIAGEPPELATFLPLWIAGLERAVGKPSSSWESKEETWLRAAIGRRDGIAGLARIARSTKRSEAARAWCDALVSTGDLAGALKAYEESAALVGQDYGRGEFLDGAALAAQVLGRKDLAKKLEAAWLGAPTLLRLSRWLLCGDSSTSTIHRRATTALESDQSKAPLLRGLLELILGRVEAAAKVLAKAEGLGWSHDGHAGHVLFAAFAWGLGGTTRSSATTELVGSLTTAVSGAFEFSGLDSGAPAGHRLPRPTVLELLQRSEVAKALSGTKHQPILDAMKAAAEHRMEGVLDRKRRGHYAHAAQLIAACVDLGGDAELRWVEGLRSRSSRFPSFQHELHEALALTGRSTVDPRR